MGGQGAKARSIAYCEDGTTPHLRSVSSGSNQVPDVVYSIEGNTIDRASTKNGKGYSEDVSPTMNTQDRHGIAYAADCRNLVLNPELSGTLQAKESGGAIPELSEPGALYHKRRTMKIYESYGFSKYREGCGTLRASGGDVGPGIEMLCVGRSGERTGGVAPTLTGDHQNRVTDYTAVCVGNGQLHQMSMAEQMNTLDCMHDQQAIFTDGKPPRKYIVRRLTPLECCRLQGFPDWWEDGVEGSDSARYKMWGNGMALPNMLHVMKGIVAMNERDRKDVTR